MRRAYFRNFTVFSWGDRPVVALQKVSCFLRLETSGNKAVEKQNLEQDPVKCLGDMSVHCES